MPTPAVGSPYDPTGAPFPDLDGSLGDGPLLIQLPGEVLSHAITFESVDLDKGVLAKLIDAAFYLYTNSGLKAGSTYQLASRSATRFSAITPIVDGTVWTCLSGDGFGAVASTTGSANAIFPFTPPHGQVLTAATINVNPAGAHGALPAVMPVIILAYRTMSTGAVTQLGVTTTDTSVDVAAYEPAHPLTVGSLSHTIDTSTRVYYLQVTSESGANAVAGMVAYGVSFTYTRTTIGED